MKARLFLAATLMLTGLASAQSAKPYWVIESNVNTKDFTKICIYDVQGKLMYEETVHGKALNILSRRDRKFLDRKLKEVIGSRSLALAKQ